MLVTDRRLLSLIATVGALGALGFPAQPLAQSAPELAPFELQVNRKDQGHIVATIEDGAGGETAPSDCTDRCEENYVVGRVVTLRAEPRAPSKFAFWSDDRCPPEPVCKLRVDRGEQTVVATFSPQLVIVVASKSTSEAGSLTSTPAGTVPERAPFVSCGNDEITRTQVWCREFPASRENEVKLHADGIEPFWGMGDFGDTCDAIVGATCSLTIHSQRQVALNFGGPIEPPVGQPGDLVVAFRIAKDGTGSGTVRSRSLDCGDKCNQTLDFGDRQTLIADPAPGSRFVRWRGACAASPRCTLAVGPVTRITAVFDALDTPSETQPSGTKPEQAKRRSSRRHRFAVRVGRIVVRGARPRRIHFTVGVSARSSIRAVLENARGRPVSARTWSVQRGKRTLRLRVPKRAKRGTYMLTITARDKAGNVKRFKRRVQLDR